MPRRRRRRRKAIRTGRGSCSFGEGAVERRTRQRRAMNANVIIQTQTIQDALSQTDSVIIVGLISSRWGVKRELVHNSAAETSDSKSAISQPIGVVNRKTGEKGCLFGDGMWLFAISHRGNKAMQF